MEHCISQLLHLLTPAIHWVCAQTVLALAVAEEAAQFEHRDLHWGNLLIKRVPASQRIACTLR